MKQLLIVDDDHSMRTILQEALSNSGYEVTLAKDGKSALNILRNERCDLVVTDLVMPQMSGIELMEIVKKEYPDVGFLIITAYGTVETAVEALHNGAYDFITKPFSISQIESRISRFFEYEHLKRENKELKRKLSLDEKFKKLVGNSKAMQQIYYQIEMVAKSDAPVFIQGESGTGKELIATAIYEHSERMDQPFLKINCSAIPETLFESTLFGHEKGAFTNAIKQHRGLFEEANGGTLLLDEISEIPIAMQAKLLRVLQEQKFIRVGGAKEINCDVRVIATSNTVIRELIDQGKFREDLFYRLNVFPIFVPPLRERPEDIPLLVDHFLKKFQHKYGYEKKEVKEDTMKVLMNHHWPGNVRQLENLIERGIIYSGRENVLKLDHLLLQAEYEPGNNDGFIGAPVSIAEMEKKLIFQTLKRTNNNRTQAANILGISVRTLRNKLHQYADEGLSSIEQA
jgi:DNA-binding NtrC family response regulator